MIITLHWDVKKFMKGMSASEKGSKMARLHVLVYLMACANQRCRCWPSIPRMADETGISASTINEAKEWLITHKALAIVPFDKREGKERAISHRQNVYQLTGVVEIEGKLWSYMLMNDEIKAAIEEELKDLNFDVNVNSERLESDRSNSAKEVSTNSSQGSTNKNLSVANNATGGDSNLDTGSKESPMQQTAQTNHKDPSPPLAPAPLPRKPRQRDPIFDAVAEHIFGVTDPAIRLTMQPDETPNDKKQRKTTNTLVGVIKSWLKREIDYIPYGKSSKQVGYIGEGEIKPEHIAKFAAWYRRKNPNASMVTDGEKFVNQWRKYASEVNAKQQPRPASPAQPAVTYTQAQIEQRQRDLRAAKQGMNAHG